MRKFKVGDKVKCINAGDANKLIKKGEMYHVIAIRSSPSYYVIQIADHMSFRPIGDNDTWFNENRFVLMAK